MVALITVPWTIQKFTLSLLKSAVEGTHRPSFAMIR